MTARKITPRERAERDIVDAIDYYAREGGNALALRFIDEIEAAFNHIAAHPESGSLRYAAELELPALRHWLLREFPYLVFYVVSDDRVDVWRILHAQRDIPEMMQLDQLTKL